MSIETARAAIVATLTERFSTLARQPSVQNHPGRFTVADLRGKNVKLPAVFVSAVSLADVARGEGKVQWVVSILTADIQGKVRDALALELATKVAGIAEERGQKWGDDTFTGYATDLGAANLYSGTDDRAQGVVLWAVSFRQKVSLGTLTDPATLNSLLTVHADYDFNADGAPDAEDTITLEGPTP